MNGAYLFGYPTDEDPAILVRLPGDELHAMSQKCTHLSCVVYFEADSKRMVCPCHEGVFDARSGQGAGGPTAAAARAHRRRGARRNRLGASRRSRDTGSGRRERAVSSAIGVYVLVLLVLQVFLP